MNYIQFRQRYLWEDSSSIGKGGFGMVYKAYDTYANDFVAIKKSPVTYLHRSKQASQSEVPNLLKRLPEDYYKNIVQHYNSHQIHTPEGVFHFVVMRYYPEGNLQEFATQQPLSAAQKMNLAYQIGIQRVEGFKPSTRCDDVDH